MSTEDVKLPDDEAEDEGSSRASNIVALVFVVGLIAFNVYAFWGYKDYSMPEVSPDKPVSVENGVPVDLPPVPGDSGGTASGSQQQSVVPVPGVSVVPDALGVSGLSPASSSASGNSALPPTAPPLATPSSVDGGSTTSAAPSKTQMPPPAVKSGQTSTAPPPGQRPEPVFATASPGATAQGKNAAKNTNTPPPPGKRPEPVFVTPTPGASASGDKNAVVAPPPGKRPEPIFATPTPGASASGKKNASVAPPPGKRPEPVFSQYNKNDASATVMLSGPQFLLGLGALCSESTVDLSAEQRQKIGAVLALLAKDQEVISGCAAQSIQYFTADQLTWMEVHRGIIDVSNVEPEAGFDPITTAYMRLLRSKKGEAKAASVAKRKSELNFQDLMNGVLKMEKEKPQLAITASQAKALMPLLVAANKARQSEAMHFQQAQAVLTAKQNAWLKDHPEKTALNVNDVILRYTQQVVAQN